MHELVMPLIPKNFNKQLKSKKSDIQDMTFVKKEATKQDVIDYYSIVRDLLPNERAFKVWMMDFMRLGKGGKPICPIPFFKQELRNIVDWESAAGKYNSLPFEGSYLDQPLFVIEGFNIVRAAENLYNSKKMEETKKKNQSNSNVNNSSRQRRRR